MRDLILLQLVIFGFSYIIGHSAISFPVRVWLRAKGGILGAILVTLSECYACLGFWVGLGMALLWPELSVQTLGCPWWYLPFFGSASNYLINKVL